MWWLLENRVRNGSTNSQRWMRTTDQAGAVKGVKYCRMEHAKLAKSPFLFAELDTGSTIAVHSENKISPIGCEARDGQHGSLGQRVSSIKGFFGT
jgi:hypothetical protein